MRSVSAWPFSRHRPPARLRHPVPFRLRPRLCMNPGQSAVHPARGLPHGAGQGPELSVRPQSCHNVEQVGFPEVAVKRLLASILIPEGFKRLARGRGAPATNTPGLRVSNIRTPAGVPEPCEPHHTPCAAFCDPCRGRIHSSTTTPGCSAAVRPRPRATICNPFGIINQRGNPTCSTAGLL